MRGCEISLVLLVLVFCEAPWGTAAPLQSVSVENLMAKLYPKGNHWAVGHLMGKKSTGDFPYAYEGGNKVPFSPMVPDISKPLSEFLQWEKVEKNLLPLLEGKDSRSSQLLRHSLLGYPQSTGDLDSDGSSKDVVESLLQVLDMKESILN